VFHLDAKAPVVAFTHQIVHTPMMLMQAFHSGKQEALGVPRRQVYDYDLEGVFVVLPLDGDNVRV
jgi:hypothetical protein